MNIKEKYNHMKKNSNSSLTNEDVDVSKLRVVVETGGDAPTARFGHTMVMINKTKAVLFAGAKGDTKNYEFSNDTFCYNVITKVWTKLKSIRITSFFTHSPREGCTCSLRE